MFSCIFVYSDYCYYNQYNLLFCSIELEMTYHENSLNTNNLTSVTAVHSESIKAVTDIPNHTRIYDVTSLYSKSLSECRIISGSLLELQETIGQGIVNNI